MSDLEIIESTVIRTARRQRWQCAWQGFWKGLLVGASLWLLALALFKLLPIPFLVPIGAAALAGVVALTGALLGTGRRIPPLQAARWIDRQQRLQERLSTALELASASGNDRWRQLLLADAAHHAGPLDPRRLLPWRLPRVSRWVVLVLVLGATLGFAPEYRSAAHRRKLQETATIRATGKQLVELTRRQIAQRPPLLDPTRRQLEQVVELGDRLNQAKLTRSDSLRDLANASERLKQELNQFKQNTALRRLENAARAADTANPTARGNLEKQMEALQKALGEKAAANPAALDQMKKDLRKLQEAAAALRQENSADRAAAQEQLSQSLNALNQQAQSLGVSLSALDDAMAALAANQTESFMRDLATAMKDLDKLRAQGQALQKLQQQANRAGKDLGEQLKFGQAQAAEQTLLKLAEQLKAANLTPEQLAKILQEVTQAVDPASPYGKVADLLKQAAEQMRQGQKPDGAQSLAEAAKELRQLLQQLNDAEALAQAMKDLADAEFVIASGQGWPGRPGSKASEMLGWGQGGRPGRGVGTWADENQEGWIALPEIMDLWDNTGIDRPDMDPRPLTDRGDGALPDNVAATKIKGQLAPGTAMPSISIKGLSLKGESSVGYKEAILGAQTEAQQALSQDQIPKAYQGAVKDYFDDLNPQKP